MGRESSRRFHQLAAALLEEGDVSVCPDGLLHFGDTVIIHAPVVQPHKGAPRASFPCTLAVTPSKHQLQRNIYEEVSVTASPHHHQPVLKNVFIIEPYLSRTELGHVLCYGDPFNLVHLTPNGEKYYITSPVGSALHSARESRRQEVLLKDEPSSHSTWRLQTHDPALRLTFHGQPVEVGSRIQLVQTMTNQPLVIEEEFTTKTIFGVEQEVSVGVVNRATTRAASTLAFLTWTRRSPPPPPEDPQPQEVDVEDVLAEERERRRQIEEEEEERRRREEIEAEENREGLRLVMDNEDDSPDEDRDDREG